MSALAEVMHVADIWQPLTPAQQQRATGLLQFASAKLRRALPDLDTWMADGRVDERLVRYTVAEAVRRVLANPHGARSESIDDYSYTRDGSLAAGELFFSDAEVESLRPASLVSSTTGAFTITPGRWA